MLINWIVFFIITVIIYFVYYVPINFKSKEVRDKRSILNRARRLRKNGKDIPPPFPNGWFALLPSSEIKPGTAKNINCLGENFVAFRSVVNKEVYILDAYCPHMGANMGVGGMVSDDCIVCPFHEWKFSGKDGSLIDIPYSEDIKSVKNLAKVRKWISREVNGLIFVWYHAENEEPWEIPAVESIENNELCFQGKTEFMIQCHIQDIPENGADRAHLKTVHGPNMFAGPDICRFRDNLLSIGLHLWDAKWNTSEHFKHVACAKINHSVKVWILEFFKVDVDITQIGPGYVVFKMTSYFGEITILQTVTPFEPLCQKISHYFYAPRGNGMLAKITIFGESVNICRDAMIWDYKTFIKNPILAKEEKPLKLYRNWYSQFYSKNSKRFQDAYDNLNW